MQRKCVFLVSHDFRILKVLLIFEFFILKNFFGIALVHMKCVFVGVTSHAYTNNVS